MRNCAYRVMPAVKPFQSGLAVLRGSEAEGMAMLLALLSGCILKNPVVPLLAMSMLTAPALAALLTCQCISKWYMVNVPKGSTIKNGILR